MLTSSGPLTASASHPLPNLPLNLFNLPASSSSTFANFCDDGFHSGEFLVSLVERCIGIGEVVRWRYVEPSESVIICVKVYGRLGRRRREACRVWLASVALVHFAHFGRGAWRRSGMVVKESRWQCSFGYTSSMWCAALCLWCGHAGRYVGGLGARRSYWRALV